MERLDEEWNNTRTWGTGNSWDSDSVEHRTLNGTMKGIPMKGVPAIGTAGVVAIVVLVGALLVRQR